MLTPPENDIATIESQQDLCPKCRGRALADIKRFSIFSASDSEDEAVVAEGIVCRNCQKVFAPPRVGKDGRPSGPTMPFSKEESEIESSKSDSKMGTLMGVYLPCLQNIFGVLFFIRLAWIVGTAGVVQGFFIVFVCCSVTFLTSISLSAIATNGIVMGGGPYYMISRNLGPELGGAVGILFFLGTSVAASMYILGAVEIFILYLVPQARIIDDLYMCCRLYGTIFLALVGLIVLAGVRVVNKFALPAVIVVLLCILCTFIGAFVNIMGKESLSFCMVGDRLVNLAKWADGGAGVESMQTACNATYLEPMFCANSTCDPYFMAMRSANRVGPVRALDGIASGVIAENYGAKYVMENEVVIKNKTAPVLHDDTSQYFVFADISTSFMILIGVFFPSCTGIMAGSNRSGDLKDASLSIPRGTIAATTSTSLVYLAGVILIGASGNEMFLRDKFGQSAYGKLVIAELAVPHPVVILIGCFLSTIGAGMQSLTGAPRLFQAIAKDGIIPFLAPFQVATSHGEPFRAIMLTLAIAEVGVLIAQLESITALITQFFLMCYLSVNAACALQSILKAPGWRPSFRYYHWSLSMFGAILCFAVMFISQWMFAIIAIIIGIGVYKYIQFRGAEKEWGDGLSGLNMSAARYALLNLEDKPPHTRNWRPQLLVLVGPDPESDVKRHERLLSLVSQLKAGKGLTVLSAVIEGDAIQAHEKVAKVKKFLRESAKKHKIKGFCDVLMCRNVRQGTLSLIQTSGLGVMRHNTIVLPWPDDWKKSVDGRVCAEFFDAIKVSTAFKCAVLVPKNVSTFPMCTSMIAGYMDIWMIVNDGGMMILLPFLLRQHRVWRRTRLRIFTASQEGEAAEKLKEEMRTFLYHLRIEADIHVIELADSEIDDYTLERIRQMQDRQRKASELQLQRSVKLKDNWRNVFQQAKKISGARNKLTQISEEPSAAAGSAQIQEKAEDDSLIMQSARRMHMAIGLNLAMRQRSNDAELILINLPEPRKDSTDIFYMSFIETLTEGLDRVLLVKGCGTEVVTIYS